MKRKKGKAPALLFRPGDIALEQAAGRRLDRRQRRAEVVRDGGEQGLAQLVGLLEHLRFGRLPAQPLALNRQPYLSRRCIQQASLLGCPGNRATPHQPQQSHAALAAGQGHGLRQRYLCARW